jgi:adenylate kinase
MGAAAGLVVEFVGLPGAGKSALSRQVAGLLRAAGVVVSEPTSRLDQAGTASRTLAKVGYGIEAAMAAPLTGAGWVRTFIAMKQRSLADTGRVALNWFFLAGLTGGLRHRPGVHLLDQGIFQGLWSAAYAAREGALKPPELVARVLQTLPPGMLVIVIETSPDTLRRRLSERLGGDSRLERDLATGESARSMGRAVAAFASMEELLDLLEERGTIAVMRVQGEHPELLQITAEAVAQRIIGASSVRR